LPGNCRLRQVTGDDAERLVAEAARRHPGHYGFLEGRTPGINPERHGDAGHITTYSALQHVKVH
jgi:hypothetical protein